MGQFPCDCPRSRFGLVCQATVLARPKPWFSLRLPGSFLCVIGRSAFRYGMTVWGYRLFHPVRLRYRLRSANLPPKDFMEGRKLFSRGGSPGRRTGATGRPRDETPPGSTRNRAPNCRPGTPGPSLSSAPWDRPAATLRSNHPQTNPDTNGTTAWWARSYGGVGMGDAAQAEGR
jgi:hypothetical protein